MDSIWSRTTEFEERKELTGEIRVQAAVIGAGMAGILTAYLLKLKGINSVVLEAGRIASGQTKNTTAKITSQHNLIYDKLIRNFGEKKAKQYADINEQAIARYTDIIEKNKIDCELEKAPAFLYSLKEDEVLKREAEAARRLGISAEFTQETELPFSVKGAVKFNGQAKFHPLKFMKALADELTVYENTRVTVVEENLIYTERGTVRADQVIFACHYPFINAPGYYFLRMHQERSYVIALKNAFLPNGMYLGIDQEGLSFRSSGEYLLLGGGSHRTGENRSGGQYEKLRSQKALYWPDSSEEAFWSAQDCMTLDGVPYIGQYSSETPDWYVASGFGKWGMTGSMVSAMIISDLVTEKGNLNNEIFSPQRFTPSASAAKFLEEGKEAVKGLSKRIFALPRAHSEALAPGHGGVVEYEGEKAGVYKDEKGEVYVVSIKCPHLGCQLEWNPDEKSWDCPCHGSRFDYKGNLLNNPAKEGLMNE